MGLRLRVVSVAAAGLMLNACGSGNEIAAPSDVVTAPTTTLVAGDNVAGDPAVWLTSDQMAAFGFPPSNATERISATSTSFTAHVMRLRCSGGETGTVLPPAIVWSETQISVTFTVDPLPRDGSYTCPSNDLVTYEVELGQPIGQRQLVDGTCASEHAAGTLFCSDQGLRWSPHESGPDDSIAGIVTTPTTPISDAASVDAVPPALDLSGVTPASVPMVISEHLNNVQQAVRADVGDDVFAGSAFTNDANDTMTIYGTDPTVLTAALARVNTPLRDRITVVETRYSLNEIENYAHQAQALLDAAGIAASAAVQYGVDAVVVELETPDGEPDDTIETEAGKILSDIPVTITFRAPYVPL